MRKPWLSRACGQGGHGQRVMCLKKLQQSLRTSLSVWGEGWGNRNHSTKRNSRKFCFLVSTPGKTQRPAAEGPFTKHKRPGSTRGAPCLSNALQLCYGFYSYNYSGSKTTSRDCKRAARINVFPLLRKQKTNNQTKTLDSAHIWHVHWTLLNE